MNFELKRSNGFYCELLNNDFDEVGEKCMSFKEKMRETLRSILGALERVIHPIYSGATRAFSPNEDNYPESGVQPYEGDPPAKNRRY